MPEGMDRGTPAIFHGVQPILVVRLYQGLKLIGERYWR